MQYYESVNIRKQRKQKHFFKPQIDTLNLHPYYLNTSIIKYIDF